MRKGSSGRTPRPLASIVRKVTSPAFRRRGFAQQEMITRWETIVGDAVAAHSQPDRIQFSRNSREGGVLHIRADGGFALELQHLEPLLLERVNAYFGYKAVTKVSIKQGPLNRPPVAKKAEPTPLTSDEEAFVESSTAQTHHEGLRHALEAMGRSLFGHSSKS